jgi:enoyl-CoA hydratase/carnithine racemase
MSSILTTTRHDHIVELTFANPPHNHATVEVLGAIGDALDAADADADIRAVVLGSEGKAFCAGADLAAADGFGGSSADPLREFYDQALRIFAAKKPIIAAIQGATIGAGLGLAVAADFRVAAPEARFGGNFVKLGFHPGFGLTITLPRLVGHQRAATILMTGDRYKPEEVAPWGLVDRIAPLAELRSAALDFARSIAVNAPLSLLETRATLRAGLVEAVRERLIHEHRVQGELRATADYAEGVAAVFERREARFTAR